MTVGKVFLPSSTLMTADQEKNCELCYLFSDLCALHIIYNNTAINAQFLVWSGATQVNGNSV